MNLPTVAPAFERLMHDLTQPAVRDLAWTIGSPILIDSTYPAFSGRSVDDAFCAAELARAEAWLMALERDPAPLHAFLDRHHSHRLGHYFETLIEFWLRREATGLRARVQARAGDHALGEFDFVFSHPRWGARLHWEATVKFYLQATPEPGWDSFIGPNPSDRLADKLHTLFDRQLQLAQTPAGRAALGEDLPAPLARACVKGYLFFPAGAPATEVAGLSAHGLRGWWLRHGEAALPMQGARPRWKLLPRLAWLAPARAAAGDTPAVFDTAYLYKVVARHFARAHTPLLLAELAEGEDGIWREAARGFVLSPDWPVRTPV